MTHWTKTDAREETLRKIKEARAKQIITEEHKRKIGIASKKWHQENKDIEQYRERVRKITKSKIGVPRLDMIGNKFSVGNKPNSTSFKKGLIPWNKNKKCPEISESLKGRITSENTKILQSKNRKEKIDLGLIKIPKGKESGSWLGGKSFESYDNKYNKRFKDLIKIRDNFCCLNCGASEQLSILVIGRGLSTHHIDYNKKNTCFHNCCTLCMTCHNLSNFNREYWIEHFQNLLSNKYGYVYEKTILN